MEESINREISLKDYIDEISILEEKLNNETLEKVLIYEMYEMLYHRTTDDKK
jgi:hypothetical protein